ncbi:MAG: hypothetical protein WC044_05545 [Crocinitomicaceae bacterium]
MKKIVALTLLFSLLFSCGGNEIVIPKPPSYLRTELPEHAYVPFNDHCPYTFETSKYFKITEVSKDNCHKDIDLGPVNGIINFSYIEMEEPLSSYVNFSNDKVDEHKIKASSIEDTKILHPENNVYGTFFELKGDVATPFQFYLTDSTSRFVSGVVYLNCRPNYDSLKPTLDYLKVDLLKMVNSFEWK